MRPLVLNYPDDPRVWELGSQYLWGDDLLVAPVTREGARTGRSTCRPGAGTTSGPHERHEGGRGVAVDAPLDRLPLLVRGGAIVPMGPVVQHADERAARRGHAADLPGGPIALRAVRGRRPDQRLPPGRARDRRRSSAAAEEGGHGRAGSEAPRGRRLGRAGRARLHAPGPGASAGRACWSTAPSCRAWPGRRGTASAGGTTARSRACGRGRGARRSGSRGPASG